MEVVAVLVALGAAVMAALAWIRMRRLQAALDALRADAVKRSDVADLRHRVETTEQDLRQTQDTLEALKAASQVLPPPLPRARSAGLDDLRQRLREAHRDPEDETGPPE